MKDGHITFEEMSDFFDELIDTEELKEMILDHLENCPECSIQYDRLRKTVIFTGELGKAEFQLDGLTEGVIKSYKSTAFKKSIIKAFPAIAASFLIIFGAGLFNSDLFKDDSSNTTEFAEKKSSQSETEKVVTIISKHEGAKIIKISPLFIEGEVSADKFRRLRRTLGFRKVSYRYASSSSKLKTQHSWRDNIEEVSAGAGNSPQGGIFTYINDRKNIRFRVHK